MAKRRSQEGSWVNRSHSQTGIPETGELKMPKDITVSNGNLLINFDFDYQIRDVYFPLVGQENHSKGLPFRFGVWVDGEFSWMGPEWEKDLRYLDNSIVTKVTLKNESLGIRLICSDAVDIDMNIYLKRIEVEDLKGNKRRVKLYFNHNFYLYGNDIGDTAYFDPKTCSIIHYKAKRYFLINCFCDGKWGVENFSCGNKDRDGKPMTWKDAEDGNLDRNPYAWGSTNSTVGISLNICSEKNPVVYYLIMAGRSCKEVAGMNRKFMEKIPEESIRRTTRYWEAWIQNEPKSFADLPHQVYDKFNRSLLILRTQIDNRGAIIAANDSDIVRFGKDTYSYMWGRDGAYVVVALAEAGLQSVCRNFFRFVARILSEEGYLFQHYNPDGTIASTWHSWVHDGREVLPIQEDSTSLVLWAFWEYFKIYRDIEFIRPLYAPFILKIADFLVSYRDPETKLPVSSYDLWEERYGTHTFTVSSVIAGLRAAINFTQLFKEDQLARKYESALCEVKEGICTYLYDEGLERYVRSGYRIGISYELDKVLDISILGLVTLGEFDANDPHIINTVREIEDGLWVDTPIGGYARYRNDQYFRQEGCPPEIPGNPWFISTLWLAEYYIKKAATREELHKSIPCLEWCARNALPSGILAEQVDPLNGSPLSVAPLTWSHSAYVRTILTYIQKYENLLNGGPG